MNVNSYLNQVLNSKASQGGNLVRPGKYLFEIVRCWFEQGRKSDYFKIELKVIKSASVGKVFAGRGLPEAESNPNAEGTTASVIIDMRNDSGPGNVKAFGLALANLDEKTSDPALFKPGGEFEQLLAQMVNEDPNAKIGDQLIPVQPMKGFLIEDETFTREIKKGENAGKPFTGHNWRHVVTGNDSASIQSRKAAQVAASAAKP